MTEEVRNRLDEELSWQDRAPVDAMVSRALSQGHHVRKVRRAGARAGTVAVVGLVVAGVTIGGQFGGTQSHVSAGVGAGTGTVPSAAAVQPVAASPAAATTTTKGKSAKAAAKDTSAAAGVPATHTAAAPTLPDAPPAVVPGPAPAGVPATSRGALQLLSEQLGTLGSTSHAGVASDGTLHVELYLTTKQGTGMVRVSLDKADAPVGCPTLDPADGFTDVTCTTGPHGDLVATWGTPGNCIQNQTVQVVHPDGTVLSFDLASCLAWDGHQNAAAPQIITAAQAAAFGADPRWDASMNPQLVSAGASNFPSPESFS